MAVPQRIDMVLLAKKEKTSYKFCYDTQFKRGFFLMQSTNPRTSFKYKSSLYNSPVKSQVIIEQKNIPDSSGIVSDFFLNSSRAEGELGNIGVESSPCERNLSHYEDRSLRLSLQRKEKRKELWKRHYGQKHFQQTQYKKFNHFINVLGYKKETLYRKLFFLDSEKQKHDGKPLFLPCTSEWEKYDKLIKEITNAEKSIKNIEEKIEKLKKQRNAFSHSAGLCGEMPIPQYGTKKDKITKRKEKYETGCPGHAEVHSGYVIDGKYINNNNAHYVYLRHCASTWFCLSCAEKVFRERQKEIKQAFKYYSGKSASFVTITVPHNSSDYFPDFMERLRKAMTRLKHGKAWQSFKEKYKVDGEIRTLEVTYSKKNGFHPHYHICLFYDCILSDQQVKDAEKWIEDRWHKICNASGFFKNAKQKKAHKQHGIVIKTSTDPVYSEYLAKTNIWEMASTTSKTPKLTESISHWDLQRLAVIEKEPWAIEKWAEFMTAMKGRIAIWWSQGLKQKVGVGNITDEELVVGEKAISVMILSEDEMKIVSARKINAKILDAVEECLRGNNLELERIVKDTGLKLLFAKPPENSILEPPNEKGGVDPPF